MGAAAQKLDYPFLCDQVLTGVDNKLSPQQVAGRLGVDFPLNREVGVSHKMIDQALYVYGRGALCHELTVDALAK